jgi:serine/threonine protein kinase
MKSWSDYVGKTVAGRWRLGSLLGVGSFGAVYVADANRTGIPMVVRLLHPMIGSTPTFDASVFTGFRHVQAVEVSDIGSFEETRYLAMRRAAGVPLKVRDPWAGDQVLELVRQIGAVLIEFQKQFDLQHLRLHLGNVHVEVAPGKKPRFQLADLGLASQAGSGELILAAIRDRRTTPECLSPEQLRGDAPTGQSDVYAFGAMLFQLLSGASPFPYTGESLSAYARHVAQTSPPRFREISEQLDVDHYIEALILRCLSKSPASRPSSIQELVDSYELAYRDFQIRSWSGMKLPISGSSNAKTNPPGTASVPAGSKMSAVAPGANTAVPSASNPISVAVSNASQLGQSKEALASVERDSTVEIFPAPLKPAETNREILRTSQSILEDVDSRMDLWAGLQPPGSSGNARVSDEALREEDSSDVRLTDDALREEDSSDVRLSDEDLQEEDSYYEPGSSPNEPPKPRAAPYRAEPAEEPDSLFTPTQDEIAPRGENKLNRISDVVSNPVSVPRQPAADGTPMPDFMRPESTIVQQQRYIQQSAERAKPPLKPSRPSRPILILPSPPRIVTALFAAVVVLAVGLLIFGNVTANRIRSEAARLVEEHRYQDAKAKLQSAQLLARVWLDRDAEFQKVLNSGLVLVRDRRKSGRLREAVEETGLIDLAFADENFADAKAAGSIREEIATDLRQRVLNLAKQHQPVAALEETQSDLVRAFNRVAKESKKDSSFDVARVKQDVFAVGLSLAREKSDAGSLDEAIRLLEDWRLAFQEERDVPQKQTRELEECLCNTRVRRGLTEAARDMDSSPPRFAEAILELSRLEAELEASSCKSRKPEVCQKRGEAYLAWAESRQGVESDVAERFANAIRDFSEAQSLLDPPSSRETTALLEKAQLARAGSYLARGRWNESRAKSQPAALMLAIKDFQAALTDAPQRPEPRQRLIVIRDQALRDAQEAFQSAQQEENHTAADEDYCRSEWLLSVVIASCMPREDDHFLRHAKLWRGLARSSRRVPDFSNAVADLSDAVADATEAHLIEIGAIVMSDIDPEIRQLQLRHLFAVGRSELAWLLATWPHDAERKAARGQIMAIEQALKATESLASLKLAVDNGKLKLSAGNFRDNLFHDECFARRAYIAALADLEQFTKSEEMLRGLQGDLSREVKGWQATLSRDLDEMLNKFLKKRLPFRSSYSLAPARKCDGQK